MIKSLFFDLDDTLYQYDGALKMRVELGVIEEFSASIGGEPGSLYLNFKKSWRNLIDENKGSSTPFNRRLWYERFLIDNNIDDVILAQEMESSYWQRFSDLIEPYDDFKMVVGDLAQMYSLYIVTDGLRHGQNIRLDALGVREYFDGMVCSDDVGNKLKPNPAIFRYALDLAECSPEEVVMIGDKPTRDIKGANEAGLVSVWLRRGSYSQMPVSDGYVPDYIIADFFELKELLVGL